MCLLLVSLNSLSRNDATGRSGTRTGRLSRPVRVQPTVGIKGGTEALGYPVVVVPAP